jgi:hypothetical protein
VTLSSIVFLPRTFWPGQTPDHARFICLIRAKRPQNIGYGQGLIAMRHLTEQPAGYGDWLTDLKVCIREPRLRASLSVNKELIGLYLAYWLGDSATATATWLGRQSG